MEEDTTQWKTSPLLGRFREPSEQERELLKKMQQECPVALFHVMNAAFNERGLCLAIAPSEEERITQ